MIRIVLLSALAVACVARAQQYNSDPKTAAILAEERYLSVNGQFGAAYQQEDGVQFKEESDADGTRRGSYSYVDPSGQRRTVNYVAGKNGFQPTGDHIPAAPAPVTNPLPQYNAPAGPAQPQQQYNRPAAQYGAQEDDGQWIDDTKQEYPANSPATASLPTWASRAAPAQQQWASAPAPAAPVQQQWASAPAQQQWASAPAAPAQQQWASAPAAPARSQWASAPEPQPQQWASAPQAPAQQWASAAPAPTPAPQRWSAPVDPTPAPHRYFPPGKLSLNRSPDGFSFSFNKS